jgi:hypothetical protein
VKDWLERFVPCTREPERNLSSTLIRLLSFTMMDASHLSSSSHLKLHIKQSAWKARTQALRFKEGCSTSALRRLVTAEGPRGIKGTAEQSNEPLEASSWVESSEKASQVERSDSRFTRFTCSCTKSWLKQALSI